MKPFTFKQRVVWLLINFIDWIVNSSKLVRPLNFISNLLSGVLLSEKLSFLNFLPLFQSLSVAFIADGNRRWIKTKLPKETFISMDPELIQEKKVKYGMDKISEFVKFAYFYKFSEVSFYCFAIKNFGRPKAEVDGIMNFIKKYGILEGTVPFKFKFYGRLDLLEPEVRDIFLKLEDNSKCVKGLIFNVFVAYSSSDDEKSMSRFSGKVDLLVRTGGERRLSDFLVRNVGNGTRVEFIKPFWPEFSIIHLWLVLFKYVLEEKYLKD